MECYENGTCAPIHYDKWISIADSLAQGTPLFSFILAMKIALGLMFVAAMPALRSHQSFWFLCIALAPYISETVFSSYYTVMFYVTLSSSYYKPPFLIAATTTCYKCFLLTLHSGLWMYLTVDFAACYYRKTVSRFVLIITNAVVFVTACSFAIFVKLESDNLCTYPVLLCILCSMLTIMLSAFHHIEHSRESSFTVFRTIQKGAIPIYWGMSTSHLMIMYFISPKKLSYEQYEALSIIVIALEPSILVIGCYLGFSPMRKALFPCICADTKQAEPIKTRVVAPSSPPPAFTESASEVAASSASLPSYAAAISNGVAPTVHFVQVPPNYYSENAPPFFMQVPVQYVPNSNRNSRPRTGVNNHDRVPEMPAVQPL